MNPFFDILRSEDFQRHSENLKFLFANTPPIEWNSKDISEAVQMLWTCLKSYGAEINLLIPEHYSFVYPLREDDNISEYDGMPTPYAVSRERLVSDVTFNALLTGLEGCVCHFSPASWDTPEVRDMVIELKRYALSFDAGVCLLPLIVCGVYPEGQSPDKVRTVEMIQNLQFSHPSNALSELRQYLNIFRDTRGSFLEARAVNFDISECMLEFLECPVFAPQQFFQKKNRRGQRLLKAREIEGHAAGGFRLTDSDRQVLKEMGIRLE